MRLMRRLSFTAKSVLIALAFVLPLFGLLASLMQSGNAQARQGRMDATRQHVEIVVGMVASAHAREVSGEWTREQAQRWAHDAISKLRYDRTEYFWINDMQGKMLMHAAMPELDGRSVLDIKDPKGFSPFQAFIDAVRRDGGGFVMYQWPRPGSKTPEDKITYVKGFEPWGWVIGSGNYTAEMEAAVARTFAWIAGVVMLALVATGYLFVSFHHVMQDGMEAVQRQLQAMAAGDLTMDTRPRGSDELAHLTKELGGMQDALRHMVGTVRLGSDDIVNSTREIASSAMDLSNRSEQASARLQEAASSIEEISAAVSNGARHTDEASTLAKHNADVASHGGDVMTAVVQSMERIKGSSAKIEDIISTIDGIAFQTNILALNAAVEAARAGEQGRGFAVVAGEVRALAQRSASAAHEIKVLIGTSVQEVEHGVDIVQQAGQTIGEIVSTSRRVDDLLAQVATGEHEQSAGVALVSSNVQDLDRITSENTALVEQTAAGARAMHEQAEKLAAVVGRFRLPAGR